MKPIVAILALSLAVGCCKKPPSLRGLTLPPPPQDRYQELLKKTPEPELPEALEAVAMDRVDAQETEKMLRDILLKLGAENPKK